MERRYRHHLLVRQLTRFNAGSGAPPGLTRARLATTALALAAGFNLLSPGVTSAHQPAPDSDSFTISADGETVPPDVASWFRNKAARSARDALVTGATDIAGTPGNPAQKFAAGAPLPLYEWSPAFLSDGTGEPAAFAHLWVAPLMVDHEVAGTIAATDTPSGGIKFAYVDDDSAAGRALGSKLDGRLVNDPEVGGLVLLGPDHSVIGLSGRTKPVVVNPGSLTELRTGIVEAQRVGPEPAPELSVSPSSASSADEVESHGPRWRDVLIGVGLAVLGLILWRGPFWRRTNGLRSRH